LFLLPLKSVQDCPHRAPFRAGDAVLHLCSSPCFFSSSTGPGFQALAASAERNPLVLAGRDRIANTAHFVLEAGRHIMKHIS
jgi:hypothetical protein